APHRRSCSLVLADPMRSQSLMLIPHGCLPPPNAHGHSRRHGRYVRAECHPAGVAHHQGWKGPRRDGAQLFDSSSCPKISSFGRLMAAAKRNRSKPAPQVRPESPGSWMRRPRVLAGGALIVLAAGLTYFPSINGGFILDDNLVLTDNRLIR